MGHQEDDGHLSRLVKIATMVVLLSFTAILLVAAAPKMSGWGSSRARVDRVDESDEPTPAPSPETTTVDHTLAPQGSSSLTGHPAAPVPTSSVQRECVALPFATLNILCFGDSLTHGNGSYTVVASANMGNYPTELKDMLEREFLSRCRGLQHKLTKVDVFNLGLNGVSVSPGPRSFMSTRHWMVGSRFAPKSHVALVMLGTNDSGDKLWKGRDVFRTALTEYITKLQDANQNLEIVIATPPAVLPDLVRAKVGVPLPEIAYGVEPIRLRETILPLIRSIATSGGPRVHLLDMDRAVRTRYPQLEPVGERIAAGTATLDEIEWAQSIMYDGLHHSIALSQFVAATFFEYLVENILPPIANSPRRS